MFNGCWEKIRTKGVGEKFKKGEREKGEKGEKWLENGLRKHLSGLKLKNKRSNNFTGVYILQNTMVVGRG